MHGLTRNAALKTIRMQFGICKVIFDIDDAVIYLRNYVCLMRSAANFTTIINYLHMFLSDIVLYIMYKHDTVQESSV